MSGFKNEILYCDAADIGRAAKGSANKTTRPVNIRIDNVDAPTVCSVINIAESGSSRALFQAITAEDQAFVIGQYPSTEPLSWMQGRGGMNCDSATNGIFYAAGENNDQRFYGGLAAEQEYFRIGPNGISLNKGVTNINSFSQLSGINTLGVATGITVKSGASSWTTRTITGSTSITVTNGSGVSGNPTLSLPSIERLENGYVRNIGINYAAGTGTFTVRGATASLSASNPGYIVLPSKATPGASILYTITADQNFIDDAGASEIIGNLFGLTTGIAYAQDVPFYIYAVTNDDEDTIQFMISRIPHAKVSPSAANIGAPDDPVADQDTYFWSLDNIDETLYDQNPCWCIGSFRMQMSASDDWTVQTLDNRDGIEQFQETREFTQVAGHFGAATGKFWRDNSGTAPSFTSNAITYFIEKSGWVTYIASYVTATAGVGNVNAQAALPLNVKNISPSSRGPSRYFDSSGSSFSIGDAVPNPNSTLCTFTTPAINAAASTKNQDIDTSDQITFNVRYPILLPS